MSLLAIIKSSKERRTKKMLYLQYEELCEMVCFGEITEAEAEEIATELLEG